MAQGDVYNESTELAHNSAQQNASITQQLNDYYNGNGSAGNIVASALAKVRSGQNDHNQDITAENIKKSIGELQNKIQKRLTNNSTKDYVGSAKNLLNTDFNKHLRAIQLAFGQNIIDDFEKKQEAQENAEKYLTEAFKNNNDQAKKLVAQIKRLFPEEENKNDDDKLIQKYAQKKLDARNHIKEYFTQQFRDEKFKKAFGFKEEEEVSVERVKDIEFADGFNDVETARNTNIHITLKKGGSNSNQELISAYLGISDSGMRAYLALKEAQQKLENLSSRVQNQVSSSVKNTAALITINSEFADIQKHVNNVSKGNKEDTTDKVLALQSTSLQKELKALPYIKKEKYEALGLKGDSLVPAYSPLFAFQKYDDSIGASYCLTTDCAYTFSDAYTEVAKLPEFSRTEEEKRGMNEKFEAIQEEIKQRKKTLLDDEYSTDNIVKHLQAEWRIIHNDALKRAKGVQNNNNLKSNTHTEKNNIFDNYNAFFNKYCNELQEYQSTDTIEAAINNMPTEFNRKSGFEHITNTNVNTLLQKERQGLLDNINAYKKAKEQHDDVGTKLHSLNGVGYKHLESIRAKLATDINRIRAKLSSKQSKEAIQPLHFTQDYTNKAGNRNTSLQDLEDINKDLGRQYDKVIADAKNTKNTRNNQSSQGRRNQQQNLRQTQNFGYTKILNNPLLQELEYCKAILGFINNKNYDKFEAFFGDAVISASREPTNDNTDTRVVIPRTSNVMNPTLRYLSKMRGEYKNLEDAEKVLMRDYAERDAGLKIGTFDKDWIQKNYLTKGNYDDKKNIETRHMLQYVGDMKPDNFALLKSQNSEATDGQLCLIDVNTPISESYKSGQSKTIEELRQLTQEASTGNLIQKYNAELKLKNVIQSTHKRFEEDETVIGKDNIYKASDDKFLEDWQNAKDNGNATEFIQHYLDVVQTDTKGTAQWIQKLEEEEGENQGVKTSYKNAIEAGMRRITENAAWEDMLNNIVQKNTKDEDLKRKVAQALCEADSTKSVDDIVKKMSIEDVHEHYIVFNMGEKDDNEERHLRVVPRTQKALLTMQDLMACEYIEEGGTPFLKYSKVDMDILNNHINSNNPVSLSSTYDSTDEVNKEIDNCCTECLKLMSINENKEPALGKFHVQQEARMKTLQQEVKQTFENMFQNVDLKEIDLHSKLSKQSVFKFVNNKLSKFLEEYNYALNMEQKEKEQKEKEQKEKEQKEKEQKEKEKEKEKEMDNEKTMEHIKKWVENEKVNFTKRSQKIPNNLLQIAHNIRDKASSVIDNSGNLHANLSASDVPKILETLNTYRDRMKSEVINKFNNKDIQEKHEHNTEYTLRDINRYGRCNTALSCSQRQQLSSQEKPGRPKTATAKTSFNL